MSYDVNLVSLSTLRGIVGFFEGQKRKSVYMNKLVIFVGQVGSGKTTQMACLHQRLHKENCKVRKAFVKTVFIWTPILTVVSLKLKIPDYTLNSIMRIVVEMELAFNTFILLPLLLLNVELQKKISDVVIVEEHVLGSVIDYVHLKGLYRIPSRYITFLMKFLGPFLTKPDAIISLTADLFTLKQHWQIRGSQPEHLDYLNSQNKIFQVSKNSNTFQFSTTESIQEVSQQIYKKLSSLFVIQK